MWKKSKQTSAALHEDFRRELEMRGPSDRGFGAIVAVVFGVIALLRVRGGNPAPWWAMATAGVALALALIAPRLLHPLNRAWMQVAQVVTRVMNPVTMGVLFFAVFTPMAVLIRLLGKQPLRLNAGPDEDGSYWIKRSPGPPPESMKHQF